MKKIGIVTGSRAEYGLLKPLMEKVRLNEDLELQVIVTGMHLSPEFGLTYMEIEKDFQIREKVEMLLSSDTASGITKSIGLGLIGFADAFQRTKPDLIILLGDRFEIWAAAAAALVARIPIAHLHGGELTMGAMDDAIRHSITKMSTLHFTSTPEYRKRVIQLGENPDHVFWVGALGVENIHTLKLLAREELEQELEISLSNQVAVVTYHPVTLEMKTAKKQFGNLLKALINFPELQVIFTKANADMDGHIINQLIDDFVRRNHKRCSAFTSLGQIRYLSVVQFAHIVIGNSSSGIIEVPSFHVPVVNIGSRQEGRIRSSAVLDCGVEQEEIQDAVQHALSKEFRAHIQEAGNPYEKTGTSDLILSHIQSFLEGEHTVKKQFYDLDCIL